MNPISHHEHEGLNIKRFLFTMKTTKDMKAKKLQKNVSHAHSLRSLEFSELSEKGKKLKTNFIALAQFQFTSSKAVLKRSVRRAQRSVFYL